MDNQIQEITIRDQRHIDLEDLVSRFDYFLFDCDGVLWNGEHEIQDSFKALKYILSFPQKKIYLITNNSSRLRETILEDKLKHFGLELPIENIYTSGYAATQYIKTNIIKDFQKDKVYVVGEQGLKNELMKAGIKVLNDQDDSQEPADFTYDQISDAEIDKDVVAVVAGINYSFSYRKCCFASLYLVGNNAVFVATNQDRYFTTKNKNRKMPAGGSIVKSIQAGTQIDPILMGKPHTLLFELLRKEHNLEHEPLSKFVMVGDSLQTDILFGNNCGIETLSVLSGNTSEEDIRKVISGELNNNGIPTYVTPYLAYSDKLKL